MVHSLRAPVLGALLLTACDPGDVVLLAPEGSHSHAPTLSIRAVIDTPYAAVAESLGWTAGVPRVDVWVHLMAEPYFSEYWQETTADSMGMATFPDLLAGLYEVLVVRRLTAAETDEANGAARVLAGGRRIWLPVNEEQEITLASDHRGSLVFSEFGNANPHVEGVMPYWFEVYNNGDTTVYLDGKYWGIAWYLNRDYPFWPCAQTATVRDDPNGIWTRLVTRFPGRGTDYPVAPGQLALIAKSAIDWGALYPGLYDLRHADFEWGGSGSVDNPEVPNLEDIGPSHLGFHGSGPNEPSFLSEPVDLTTLPRYLDPHSGSVYLRIPRALIIDASSAIEDFAAESYEPSPSCLEDLNRVFERLPGPAYEYFTDYPEGLSVQRRVVMTLPDGRKVLQDTDTSMEDFVKSAWTPGWIPDSLP